MKVSIASDHAGFFMKEYLRNYLATCGHEVKDLGAYSEASVDYPDFAHKLAMSVECKEAELGILLCGSGNGVCITANRHKGIRAALAWKAEIAELARLHNNANVLCLPARYLSEEEAHNIVKIFLATSFEGGRHEVRVEKI